MRSIVSICGTSRPGNYTSMALGVVHDELGRVEAAPTVFEAGQLALGFPGHPPTADAESLRAAVESADGVVIGSPEYHGGYSAMTKLIIENLGFPSALAGKPVALVGVAAGRIGAIKSLEQLRGVCAHIGALVIPTSVSVAGVRGAFDSRGECTDAKVEDALRGVASALLDFIRDGVCPKYTLEALVRQEGGPWASSV